MKRKVNIGKFCSSIHLFLNINVKYFDRENSMLICVFCEQEIDDDSVFCPYCGSKITYGRNSRSNSLQENSRGSNRRFYANSSSYQNNVTGYNSYQYSNTNSQWKFRTPALTAVLVINYIGVALLAFFSLILFAVIPVVGIIFLGITGLYFWLNYALQEYNNKARIITLILNGLGALVSLVSFNIIGLAIALFEIYVLAFHDPTLELFDVVHSTGPISNQNNYYNNSYNRNY